ncbi:MAG: helix-turn-helix domain-containing protein [Propionibacteriales bacterium]|nr:helix-turn-helix domain-containing protein [Propionibacteriales bacterium]
METLLLKIPEVMARLAVGQTKVYELLSSGELRSVKVGRSRRVPSNELDRFMAELDDSRPNVRLPVPRGSTARAS